MAHWTKACEFSQCLWEPCSCHALGASATKELHLLNGFPFAHQPFAEESIEGTRRGQTAEENESPVEVPCTGWAQGSNICTADLWCPPGYQELGCEVQLVTVKRSHHLGCHTEIVSGQTVSQKSKAQLPLLSHSTQWARAASRIPETRSTLSTTFSMGGRQPHSFPLHYWVATIQSTLAFST